MFRHNWLVLDSVHLFHLRLPVRLPPPDSVCPMWPHSCVITSAFAFQLCDSFTRPCIRIGVKSSQQLLVTDGLVTESERGWRVGTQWKKHRYRGQNLAVPLFQDIKVGQSVPWMLSNSTFRGLIHWKYTYTCSVLHREGVNWKKRTQELTRGRQHYSDRTLYICASLSSEQIDKLLQHETKHCINHSKLCTAVSVCHRR